MEIPITSEINRFKTFLDEKDNINILFSGKFGIGKSYFIEKFFEQNGEDYLMIYISPVNYSVASNEDIFEYIKINILFELLENSSFEFTLKDISFTEGAIAYLKNNPWKLLSTLATIGEKIAFRTDIIVKLIELKVKIDEFIIENKYNKKKDIKNFIKRISELKGSIFENDIITQIIRSIINEFKNDSNKQIILVVDDLDRIDPEHIFRIMNICSAHQCFCGTNEQKFNIDKTILVCDIDNLRNIYHGHHGQDVDFCGYIDKFYSKEVFHFNNLKNIISSIRKIAETAKVGSNSLYDIDNTEWITLLHEILNLLFKYKKINIRSFLKIENKDFDFTRYFIINGSERYDVINCPAIIFFEVLKIFFPNFDEMKKALKTIELGSIESNSYIVSIFILLADYENGYSLNEGNYLGCKYKVDPKDKKSFSAKVETENLSISKTTLIQDAFSNYVRYCQ